MNNHSEKLALKRHNQVRKDTANHVLFHKRVLAHLTKRVFGTHLSDLLMTFEINPVIEI